MGSKMVNILTELIISLGAVAIDGVGNNKDKGFSAWGETNT